MSISSKFEAAFVEKKWYDYWLSNKYFASTPDHRPSYSIVIPPPNVTGVLHMGHMLNVSLQDILIRRARMQGLMPVGYQVPTMHLLQQKQRLLLD